MTASGPASRINNTHRWLMAGFGAVALVAAAGVLFLFNPSENGFYPRCFLKSFTGLDCPGCGGLRAMHQLLHGHFGAAFRLNPLLFLMMPLAAFFALRQLIYLSTGRLMAQPFKSPRWLGVFALIVVVFGVLRNLPWHSWFGA